ncbi:hypothetical protein PO124_24680 [Bacillus licheniformis]|nr:hypothetical protein [Bacillus licheniformis]
MQDNGAMLAAKLREIYQYFGRKVILVSYSKGGIDSQSALIHHNAYHYVERVITLGTPITAHSWQTLPTATGQDG